MPSLAPFLPPHLARSLAMRGAPARLPHVERFPAALLFSDITGFTAMTERLQSRGRREGAEEIAEVVSAAFRPAFDAIDAQQGSVVSFGGDALFALFDGEEPVTRARRAAEAIRRSFAGRGAVVTSAGTVRLGISQAIHHGEVRGIHVGRADARTLVTEGAAVRTLARLQGLANRGALLLSPAARAQERREGGGRSRQARRPGRAAEALFRPYLDARLRAALDSFEGRYRRTAILFLETRPREAGALQSFAEALLHALSRYEGLLLKTDLSPRGTKWMCLFGIPEAHEEDPERAARAALDVVAASPRGLVRGGLHAGVVANVLVGVPSRRSFDVMGDVVNTAMRTLESAAWGEVLVTGQTRSSIPGIETVARGRRSVKGKARSLELHALVRPGPERRPLETSARLAGRERELAALVEALGGAAAGRGSVRGIRAEAGLGKSRLVHEAAAIAREMGLDVHVGRAPSLAAASYGAIGSLLCRMLELPDAREREATLDAVRAAGRRLGLPELDRQHLAEVLGAREEGALVDELPPRDVRLNDMIAIRSFCTLAARERPRLLVLDDMHAADESSRQAAAWLAAAAPGAGFLLLLAYRPGYAPPEGTEEIVLGELDGAAMDELVWSQLGHVDAAFATLLKERASGNPFHLEELARHLLEIGVVVRDGESCRLLREPLPGELPGSVESLIAARLDRLSPGARRAAQVAAVIGRSFRLELLASVTDAPRQATRAVQELFELGLVLESSRAPHREYVWRQSLTRDVAYASILAARRRALHRAVADALEALFPAEREAFLPLLGHHRESSGDGRRARGCYLLAAHRAIARHAHDEAERLLRGHLRLAGPPTPRSIRARVALGTKVLRPAGHKPEAEVELRLALREARRIADRRGEREAVGALAEVVHDSGRIPEAASLKARAVRLARDAGNRRAEAVALSALAELRHDLGRVEDAVAMKRAALALLGRTGHPDRGVVLASLASIEMERGNMDEARRLLERAADIARRHGRRSAEALQLASLARLLAWQGELDRATDASERVLAIAREVGNRKTTGWALQQLGGLCTEAGKLDEARARLLEALALHRSVGDRHLEGTCLTNLANVEVQLGRDEEAARLYIDSAAVHQATANRRSEAIALGGLAGIRVRDGRLDEARDLYARALASIRELGDPRFEGCLLGYVVEMESLASDAPADLEALAKRAHDLLSGVGDRVQLALLHTIRGHLVLAAGRSAAKDLALARSLGGSAGTGSGGLAREIAKLARAQAAHEEGRPLVRGFHPEDLTPGQHRWVETSRGRKGNARRRDGAGRQARRRTVSPAARAPRPARRSPRR